MNMIHLKAWWPYLLTGAVFATIAGMLFIPSVYALAFVPAAFLGGFFVSAMIGAAIG
jgi:hypothetical protein